MEYMILFETLEHIIWVVLNDSRLHVHVIFRQGWLLNFNWSASRSICLFLVFIEVSFICTFALSIL
jgi:hypothetical protein